MKEAVKSPAIFQSDGFIIIRSCGFGLTSILFLFRFFYGEAHVTVYSSCRLSHVLTPYLSPDMYRWDLFGIKYCHPIGLEQIRSEEL
jgi:hypothetical protein